MIQQGAGKSYHEWFMEFEQAPANLEFAARWTMNCAKKIYIMMT